MLATNTYCSGSHGDYSHPTLDLRKSCSRFTPLFLALHKSFPPPLSCVMRCTREGGKMVKGDTTSKQMKLQTKRTCKTENLYFFFTQKNMFRQERMVSKNVRTNGPRVLFKVFGWDMIKNIKEISIVSNKTMLIMWLKIFSLGHLAVVENWITGLDHLRDCVRNGSINCVFIWTWEPLFPFTVI